MRIYQLDFDIDHKKTVEIFNITGDTTSIPSIIVDNALNFQIQYYYKIDALRLNKLYRSVNGEDDITKNEKNLIKNSLNCKTYDENISDCREVNETLNVIRKQAPTKFAIQFGYTLDNTYPCNSSLFAASYQFDYLIEVLCTLNSFQKSCS